MIYGNDQDGISRLFSDFFTSYQLASILAVHVVKLGIVSSSISRAAGGISPVIRALAGQLGQLDVNVQIFAGEDSHSNLDREAWGSAALHLHKILGPAALGYQPMLVPSLRSASLDVVHQHGLWMYPSKATLTWSRCGGRKVISPHGMLDAWAISNSSGKKRIASWLYENANLESADCLHALCDAEVSAIRAQGLVNPVAVIPNGVDLPDVHTAYAKPAWKTALPGDALSLLFLGRIHPKKGLVSALDAFAMKFSEKEGRQWHLIVAGWDQGGHQDELKEHSRTLGLSHRVHFIGPQYDEDKAATLAGADAFILPSLSEGLPMAVLEAWAFSLPVIMTSQCNLPEGFIAGAAIKVNPNAESINAGLTSLFHMDRSQREQIGINGRNLVERQYNWGKIASDFRQVYEWVLEGGDSPTFVSATT